MHYDNCWYVESCNQFPDGCSHTCIRYAEMLEMVRLSNLPKSKWHPFLLYAGRDLDAFIRLAEIKDSMHDWVKRGNQLYIYSQHYGNGKTSWSVRLLLAYFNSVWAGNGLRRRGIFLSVPEFLDRNREAMSDRDPEFIKLREDLITCDLVVWDDITSTKLTSYQHSMLLNYIDARVNANLANIYTGNADEETMQTYLGGRLFSRIWNLSELIELKDSDKRGEYSD